jgi:DNA repair photolyase
MAVAEKHPCKSALTPSGIPGADWAANPYYGCTHACAYCYVPKVIHYDDPARPWGRFVMEKENYLELLARQAPAKRQRGCAYLSTSCDPYQPLEQKTLLTRRCIEVLLRADFDVSILTKSPLVTRDADLLRGDRAHVGVTVTTDDEATRRLFEPGAPPIGQRIAALAALRRRGVSTHVFVGPILPIKNPRAFAERLARVTDHAILCAMNHRERTAELYARHGLRRFLSRDYRDEVREVFGRCFKVDAECT